MEATESNRLKFDGDGWELLKLYLFNALATISTLGIYSFWARVKVFRYLRNHLIFFGQRFDYHATGKERLIGFIKAAPVALIYYFALKIPLDYVLPEDYKQYAPYGAILIMFYTLLPFIYIGRTRYNLSRTSYNNIRFHFSGRVSEVVRIFLLGIPLIVLTIGIYAPWFSIRLQKFDKENTYYGTVPFSFDGIGTDLLWIHLKGIFFSILTCGIFVFWWQANIKNYYWNHTLVNGIRFKGDLRGEDIMVYTILSYLLLFFTVLIAAPWVAVIWLKLYLESVSIEVKPDLNHVGAGFDVGASALAEGFESALEAIAEIFD
ncbi:YjgN family protein [Leptospira wolffii]|uniref:YjgN family protein n=1 Tax=Leptospira wolffii TaxID=409998 RepID=A0ABV5BMZ7_9LEPT